MPYSCLQSIPFCARAVCTGQRFAIGSEQNCHSGPKKLHRHGHSVWSTCKLTDIMDSPSCYMWLHKSDRPAYIQSNRINLCCNTSAFGWLPLLSGLIAYCLVMSWQTGLGRSTWRTGPTVCRPHSRPLSRCVVACRRTSPRRSRVTPLLTSGKGAVVTPTGN